MSSRLQRNVVAEFDGAVLGDDRRTKRAKVMAERFAQNPGASIPQAMVTPAELQGAYGLLNCEDATPQALMAPHVKRTLERCSAHPRVLLLHLSLIHI